jgi:hypothetical protein
MIMGITTDNMWMNLTECGWKQYLCTVYGSIKINFRKWEKTLDNYGVNS